MRCTGVAGLAFSFADAEALPFAAAEFDVVLNVESSHCYGDVRAFVAEAARVLRPGGRFLLADFRAPAEMAALEALLRAQPGLKLVEREDITANVVLALEQDDARKRRLIGERTSTLWRGLMQEFAGQRGGLVYRGFAARDILYSRFACRKLAEAS